MFKPKSMFAAALLPPRTAERKPRAAPSGGEPGQEAAEAACRPAEQQGLVPAHEGGEGVAVDWEAHKRLAAGGWNVGEQAP